MSCYTMLCSVCYAVLCCLVLWDVMLLYHVISISLNIIFKIQELLSFFNKILMLDGNVISYTDF